jgi:hypothetical protein
MEEKHEALVSQVHAILLHIEAAFPELAVDLEKPALAANIIVSPISPPTSTQGGN